MYPQGQYGGAGTLAHLFLVAGISLVVLPPPGEMSDYMIGCSIGNFRPSSTCDSVCRLLRNRTACCYGVNYDSRAICACCELPPKGKCPTVCSASCQIITINAGNCSDLRSSKHRRGDGSPGSNNMSILSDAPEQSRKKPWGMSSRSDLEEEEEKDESNSL